MGDLFDAIEGVDGHNEDPFSADHVSLPGSSVIGSFCSGHRLKAEARYIRVKPNAAVVDAIRLRALTDHDTWSFGLVERADGMVLVTAQPSKILSSLWLALIPVGSIPSHLFEPET